MSSARAQGDAPHLPAGEPPATDHPAVSWRSPISAASVALLGQLGLGAPLGIAGVLVELQPLPWLAADIGGGVSTSGGQVAAGLRGRLPFARRSALDLGATYSVGPYESVPESPLCITCRETGRYEWWLAHWVGLDVGVASRFYNGLQIRPHVGFTRVVNQGDHKCHATFTDLCEDEAPGTLLPYVGVQLGHAWPL